MIVRTKIGRRESAGYARTGAKRHGRSFLASSHETTTMDITQPTTIAEMRRLANAFLSGSRYAAGTQVYVVMSRSGLMPISAIVPISSPNADRDVDDALGSAANQQANDLATYQVTVPATVTALNLFNPGAHGPTTCTLVERAAGSAAPPAGAKLGDIKSSSLHVTWSDDSTSVYNLDDKTDAVFYTRGAMELFAFTLYQAVYGSAYLDLFKPSIE